MHCYTVCFLLELLYDVRRQLVLSAVIPDSDCSVTRAGSHDLLLEADVHAEDSLRMERTD